MASVMGLPLALSDTGAQPETVQGQLVSGDFFDVLGVKAVVGRTFRPEEDRTPGTHLVAVLSYDGWQRYFAGDPAVVGKTITLNRQPFTVVGIAPQGFRGINVFARPVVWLPTMCYQQVLSGFLLENFESRRGLVWQVVGAAQAWREPRAGAREHDDARQPARAGVPDRQPGRGPCAC